MKKVLVISYFFPPLAGAGIQRTLKFTRYLPQFNWMPLVLTQKNGHHYAYDHEQLQLVPEEVRVVRANSLEGTKFRLAARKLLKSIVVVSTKSARKGDHPAEHEASTSKAIPALSAIRRLLEQWVFVPDSKIRWLPAAVAAGLKIIDNERVDVLYSTSYPYTSHLVGYLLKSACRKPWVADFRDPWADNVFMTRNFSAFRKKIDGWLERKVVSHADSVILNTRPTAERFAKKYVAEEMKKFQIIPNGYDLDDFRNVTNRRPKEFSIVFTGTLNQLSSPGRFFEALYQILHHRPDIAAEVKVLFVGWMDPVYRKRIRDLRIDHMVDVLEYVPRRECLQIMADAAVLLLPLSREAKEVFPGKIFDYLAAAKPILALLPRGIAAELVGQTESGIVVDPDNTKAVVDAIMALFTHYKRNTLPPRRRALPKEFSRKQLTGKLAGVFDNLV